MLKSSSELSLFLIFSGYQVFYYIFGLSGCIVLVGLIVWLNSFTNLLDEPISWVYYTRNGGGFVKWGRLSVSPVVKVQGTVRLVN